MAKIMQFISVISLIMTITFALIYQVLSNDIVFSLMITFATIMYHFVIRLLVGGLINFFMRNQADYTKKWFYVSGTELRFYQFIKVKKWKNKMPTYREDTFDVSKHSWDEIVQATCQSELVHELNVILSFVPILTSLWVGAFEVFFITSIISAGFDLLFVFMQRFNRSRIMKMMTTKCHENATSKHLLDNGTREEFDRELEVLLQKAEALIPEELLPDLPYMKDAPDVHDWYMFEHELWGVGEEIRQLILKYKKKIDKNQIDRIVNICLDKRAKRGRQSFVLLLGKKQYAAYADKIVTVLEDDDVDGQVINTLYKMHAGQYVELMKPFLNHKRTWIKNEAKRFINKFEQKD